MNGYLVVKCIQIWWIFTIMYCINPFMMNEEGNTGLAHFVCEKSQMMHKMQVFMWTLSESKAEIQGQRRKLIITNNFLLQAQGLSRQLSHKKPASHLPASSFIHLELNLCTIISTAKSWLISATLYDVTDQTCRSPVMSDDDQLVTFTVYLQALICQHCTEMIDDTNDRKWIQLQNFAIQ